MKRLHLFLPCCTFRKTRSFFFEGDTGENFYIVYAGSVELFKSTLDARDIIINSVEAGELFGEIVLFEGNSYPVSARAKRDTTLISVNRSCIISLLDDSAFRDELFAALFAKIRLLAERIIFLSSLDVEERFLMYLKKNYGQHASYTVTEPKKDIAREIGTVPETFSRMVKKLKKRGMVWDGESLSVPDDIWNDIEFV
ncbi:MAG: Crp/Fnr family transcriptional regulator [Spirochaetota bacterium]